MESFINGLYTSRLEDADWLDRHPGIRAIVEELYPDKAHFIYELLQNAEDTGASKVRFQLAQHGLTFEHDGRAFTEGDIDSITNIGESTKQDKEEKIGRFGIGFKAVFAFTETPQVHSGTAHFQISRLVVPEIIAPISLGGRTVFRFPFNNPEKEPAAAYKEIKEGLDDLAHTTLLFLNNIESIEWIIEGGVRASIKRIEHHLPHIELTKTVERGKAASSHWLKFSKPVPGKEHLNVGLAYALETLSGAKTDKFSENYRIKPINGSVSVFFPAEKEVSGLKFNLHAPFVPELSRASIKDTEANTPLYKLVADLSVDSLWLIKKLGLINSVFLAVLPNDDDAIANRYVVIARKIHEAMRDSDLCPCFDGQFRPGASLLQATKAYKNVFSSNDMRFLYGEESHWAIGVKFNSRTDKLLSSVGVEHWNKDSLLDALGEQASIHCDSYEEYGEPSCSFVEWVSNHGPEWHQKFYSLLYNEFDYCYELSDLCIIRQQSGRYATAGDCYYPSNSGVDDDLAPQIWRELLEKHEDGHALSGTRKLFEELDVKTYGRREECLRLLVDWYDPKKKDRPDFLTHISHVKSFIEYNDKNSFSTLDLDEFTVLLGKDGNWYRSNQIYLGQPYSDAGLDLYFGCWKNAPKVALSPEYASSDIPLKALFKFVEEAGGSDRIKIKKVPCRGNPKWSFLQKSPGRWTEYRTDRDYTIEHLSDFLRLKDLSVSRAIWKVMSESSHVELEAYHRSNGSNPARTAPSQLVVELTRQAWVPQTDGTYVAPQQAKKSLLPNFLEVKGYQPWIDKIGLFAIEKQSTQKQQNQEAVAKSAGFKNLGELAKAKRLLKAIPDAEIEDVINSFTQPQFELPERAASSSAIRQQRLAEEAREAPERLGVEKTRTIQVNKTAIKEEAKLYLEELYTNEDDILTCQICQDAMPFKLKDGSYYFEAVELIHQAKKHYRQNYLALCPTHAAMYRYANESKDELKENAFNLEDEIELPVTLAGENCSIYFTSRHLADLKTALNVDDSPGGNQGKATAIQVSDQVEPNCTDQENPTVSGHDGINFPAHLKGWKKAYLYEQQGQWLLTTHAGAIAARFPDKTRANQWWGKFAKFRGMDTTPPLREKRPPKKASKASARSSTLPIQKKDHCFYCGGSGEGADRRRCSHCMGTGKLVKRRA